MSLGHLLRERAEAAGHRTLLRFPGVAELTVADADLRSNRLANGLARLGVGKGDRVVVMLANGLGFPLLWFALAKLGAVIVPVNAGYRRDDLRHVLTDSGAGVAVAGTPEAARLLRDAGGVRAVVMLDAATGDPRDGEYGTAIDISDPHFELGDVGPGDLLNLQYTSGTTGFPKGCMLTHGYWLRLAGAAADLMEVREDDVDMTAQPYSYMDPQWNTVLCLMAGIPLVVLPRFSASGFWGSVREHGVTFFYVLGTMPVYLLKQPADPVLDRAHRVRAVLCSGIAPGIHRALEERWGAPWREAYGSTETGVDLFVPLEDAGSVGSGLMGRPVPGKRVEIRDGEMVVKGEPMMLGYWNRPPVFDDGWFHTGDLVERAANGYFRLVGRTKDMIRRGGENIAAAEVEAVLTGHPSVLAAAVVPVPDELRGEEVLAYLRTREPVEPGEVVKYVADRLAKFKVPRFVVFVDDFPMTPSERIAKHALTTAGAHVYDAVKGEWVRG
ncbi:AMP-binding protein [Sinosporangium siamense]|uniref:Acyl-CoA synthetase n=1 Tax=Sinosporangium siamense TaxID=1367973 RepID=A0A919RHI7_9ACTN|nr:AMP-binding protein [Sinosporangium siamense]GII92066.1 acyl-CoA synthetase [Sinosporangium siamense]